VFRELDAVHRIERKWGDRFVPGWLEAAPRFEKGTHRMPPNAVPIQNGTRKTPAHKRLTMERFIL
jgi:hypothetical protein